MITGATKGIGKKIGCHLAKQQHLVFALDSNESAGFELAEFEPRIRFIKTDMTNEAELIKAFDSITLQFGRIDTIINNDYEINCNQQHVSEQDIFLWEKDLLKNFTVPMLMIKQAHSYLKKSCGSVINCLHFEEFNSLSAQLSIAGVSTFTRSLAGSLKPDVKVNCIISLWNNGQNRIPKESGNNLQGIVTKEKKVQEKEVISLIDFLIGPQACTLTGQEFIIGEKE